MAKTINLNTPSDYTPHCLLALGHATYSTCRLTLWVTISEGNHTTRKWVQRLCISSSRWTLIYSWYRANFNNWFRINIRINIYMFCNWHQLKNSGWTGNYLINGISLSTNILVGSWPSYFWHSVNIFLTSIKINKWLQF